MAAPPDGMRWLGINGVVVAVPEGWETETDPCSSAGHGTVRFLGPARSPSWCPRISPAGDVSSLLVAPTDGPLLEAGRLRHEAAVHGLEVRHGGVGCRASSIGPCFLTFFVPDADALFEVSYRGRTPQEFVTAVRDSVTRVPDGYTTVPAIAYGTSMEDAKRQLAEAGLSAQSPDVDFPHYATGSQPEPGTVVADGTTVELTIGDG